MKPRRSQRLDAIARLFRYPGDDCASDTRVLAERLHAEGSQAARAMHEFAGYTSRTSLHELEETYTRTFDLNPSCSPEIGWHLFGEEYVRGLFMVQMRMEMKQRGLEETGELPDHVVHVLAVLGAMDDQPARELARACLAPAIGRMLRSFDRDGSSASSAAKKGKRLLPHGVERTPSDIGADQGGTLSSSMQQPFRLLVTALAELVLEEFDLPSSALQANEEERNATRADVDPLRGMPCGGCDSQPGGPDLQQIQTDKSATSRSAYGEYDKEHRS